MADYAVWITLLSPEIGEMLCGKLAGMGYGVKPYAQGGKLAVGPLLALGVSTQGATAKKKAPDIMEVVRKLLKGWTWWSIIVQGEGVDCTWSGNDDFLKKVIPPAPTLYDRLENDKDGVDP